MSTYVIGDIQGCYEDLQRLLTHIDFNPQQDHLWSVGDLVNRGPRSLEVLRFFRQLGERAVVVLGNHDLHLLAVAYGNTQYLKPKDTLEAILQAPDSEDLLIWLRHRPLLHYDITRQLVMVHAGLPPQWDLATACRCAQEVEETLKGKDYRNYFSTLYGNLPKQWSDDLQGADRVRFITNCFTRLRFCDEQGRLALKYKGIPGEKVMDGIQPWFTLPNRATRHVTIVFGHWSTLGYYDKDNVYALDTGCVWGGALSTLRLEDKQLFQIACQGECIPGED